MQLKSVPEDFVVVEVAQHPLCAQGQFVLLEMTKRNLTTERAIVQLSDYLRAPRKLFGYAGTKDARALTRQFVSVRAAPDTEERLRHFKGGAVAVRVIGRIDEPLGLGMLEKNRFEIVVRRIAGERIVPLRLIPNYFDEQRFSKANAQIGRSILKGEFKAAVEVILKTDTEAQERLEAYLADRPTDHIGALRLMPKSVLLMYVHAYQSLLYNEILRRHIRSQDPAAVEVDGPVPLVIPTKDLPQASVPIFGFGTESHPVFGPWYEEILAREGLGPRDFIVRALPFLTVEGGERDAFFEVDALEAGELEPDDLFEGFQKQRLTFTLPKSCYATMVVKCLYRVGSVSGNQ